MSHLDSDFDATKEFGYHSKTLAMLAMLVPSPQMVGSSYQACGLQGAPEIFVSMLENICEQFGDVGKYLSATWWCWKIFVRKLVMLDNSYLAAETCPTDTCSNGIEATIEAGWVAGICAC